MRIAVHEAVRSFFSYCLKMSHRLQMYSNARSIQQQMASFNATFLLASFGSRVCSVWCLGNHHYSVILTTVSSVCQEQLLVKERRETEGTKVIKEAGVQLDQREKPVLPSAHGRQTVETRFANKTVLSSVLSVYFIVWTLFFKSSKTNVSLFSEREQLKWSGFGTIKLSASSVKSTNYVPYNIY